MSVLWVGAAATVASGAMSANASSKASKAQAQSAADATQLQREQFDRTVELNEPFRRGGLAGQNRLLYLLGLDPGGSVGGGAPAETAEQVRERLAPQYMKTTPDGAVSWEGQGESAYMVRNPGGTTTDDAALNAAVQAEMARLSTQGTTDQGNRLAAATQDPEYGSLMRDFSMADYQEDPGYQFRLGEGNKGLTRQLAAGGSLYSGKALKDILNYNQGAASQEYGNAFNRFQTNRSNKLNPLQSLAGVGQSATNTLTNAGQNYASNAGSSIMQGGNARASGYVGQANAVNGAVGQGWGMYQDNRLMGLLRDPAGGAARSRGYTVPNYENPEY